MKFDIYGQKYLINLPSETPFPDLRSLAAFNRLIRNYLMMLKIEEESINSDDRKNI